MSEKFKNVQRKVKEGVSLLVALIPCILFVIVFVTIAFILAVILRGIIIKVCWNVAMTTMFDFQEITVFQAFVLSYTISSLRADFINDIKSAYTKINDNILDMIPKISDMIQKEKMANILSAIFTALLEAIYIWITIWVVMYSWNSILPNLLNIELCHINFVQAFGFAFLFNFAFGISKSENKKSKNDEENGNHESVEDMTENI